MLTNAWVVDDAYITFRTIDNLVNGYGLTWNPDERVQVYTHPLWMFIVAFFYLITSELFFTVIILSFVIGLASIFIVWKTVGRDPESRYWKSILLILCLISSKAVIDYSASGLENPLSYFLISIFLFRFMSFCKNGQERGLKSAGILFMIASLAFLNRPDLIILFIPPLVYVLYLFRSYRKWPLVRMFILATLPITIWLLFSVIYYGYLFPNTAYAKALTIGFPISWKLQRGLEYLTNSIIWDTASHCVIGAAVWFVLRSKSREAMSILIGIAFYIVFVIYSGASATHMSGRFLAVPFFIGIFLFVYYISGKYTGLIISACLVVYIAWNPVSAIKFGTSAYRAYEQNPSYIDTKWYVLNEGAALLNWRPGRKMPDHKWYHYGSMIRLRPGKVHVGGAIGGDAIGYAGFAAGPERHFVDRVALSDPLLARFPAWQPENIDLWKSGHFHRPIPGGYVEGLATGENLIRNQLIRQYYDKVRIITRDSVFSWERFRVIINMNLGRYQHLLDVPTSQFEN
jgi:arabinofuranosyltransferase